MLFASQFGLSQVWSLGLYRSPGRLQRFPSPKTRLKPYVFRVLSTTMALRNIFHGNFCLSSKCYSNYLVGSQSLVLHFPLFQTLLTSSILQATDRGPGPCPVFILFVSLSLSLILYPCNTALDPPGYGQISLLFQLAALLNVYSVLS